MRTTKLGCAQLWSSVVCTSVALLACTGPTSAPPDLPADWQDAERIDDFVQRDCDESAYGDAPETLDAGAEDGRIAIEYGHAHFRCAQDVEGFLRRGGARADVLVQPIDMDPLSVAGCDCLYDISMTIAVEPGQYALTLYRRWDNINDPNDPVEVGSTDVEVDAE